MKHVSYAILGVTLIALVFLVALFVSGLVPIPEPTTDSDQYYQAMSGEINLNVAFVDELGNVVKPHRGLSFFSESVRIKSVRLTVTWETYDVQSGLDPLSFSFQGQVNTSILCSSVGEQWTKTVDIDAGDPDISSPTLNSSKQWDLTLWKEPLKLDDETALHPEDRTDFTLTFSLDWTAQMYDTVDEFWETASGDLSVSIDCYYVRGFKIKVSGGT